MIEGLTYYVLEDDSGNVHAITGGWDWPDVVAWAIAQCEERNAQREGDSRGGTVFQLAPSELSVWLCGDGSALASHFPGETWATFGNSRRCGDVEYVYPGEWVWTPTGARFVMPDPEDVRRHADAEPGRTPRRRPDIFDLCDPAYTPRPRDVLDGPDESFGVDPDLARDIERRK